MSMLLYLIYTENDKSKADVFQNMVFLEKHNENFKIANRDF